MYGSWPKHLPLLYRPPDMESSGRRRPTLLYWGGRQHNMCDILRSFVLCAQIQTYVDAYPSSSYQLHFVIRPDRVARDRPRATGREMPRACLRERRRHRHPLRRRTRAEHVLEQRANLLKKCCCASTREISLINCDIMIRLAFCNSAAQSQCITSRSRGSCHCVRHARSEQP